MLYHHRYAVKLIVRKLYKDIQVKIQMLIASQTYEAPLCEAVMIRKQNLHVTQSQ